MPTKPDDPTLAVRTAEMLAVVPEDLESGAKWLRDFGGINLPSTSSTFERLVRCADGLILAASAIRFITDLDAERVRLETLVEKYEKRLEIDHCYTARPKTERTGDVDHDLVRQEIPAEERGKYPDGVECRDATIALLEGIKEDLETDLDAARRDAEALAGGLRKLMDQCGGPEHPDSAIDSYDATFAECESLLAAHTAGRAKGEG